MGQVRASEAGAAAAALSALPCWRLPPPCPTRLQRAHRGRQTHTPHCSTAPRAAGSQSARCWRWHTSTRLSCAAHAPPLSALPRCRSQTACRVRARRPTHAYFASSLMQSWQACMHGQADRRRPLLVRARARLSGGQEEPTLRPWRLPLLPHAGLWQSRQLYVSTPSSAHAVFADPVTAFVQEVQVRRPCSLRSARTRRRASRQAGCVCGWTHRQRCAPRPLLPPPSPAPHRSWPASRAAWTPRRPPLPRPRRCRQSRCGRRGPSRWQVRMAASADKTARLRLAWVPP